MLLARNWSKTQVLDCLEKEQKYEVIRFLRERYEERFFVPIRYLKTAEGNDQGFGFAVMSLCCLLIETFECYRQGLPSSYHKELQELANSPENENPPAGCKLEGPFNDYNSGKTFLSFFTRTEHVECFPGCGRE